MSELDTLQDREVLENVFVDRELMGEIAEDVPDVLDALVEDNLEYEPTFLEDVVADYIDEYPDGKRELAKLGIIKMVPEYLATETYTFPDEELAIRPATMKHNGRELHKITFSRRKDYIIPRMENYEVYRMWEHRSSKDVYAEFKKIPAYRRRYGSTGKKARRRCGLWYQRTRADPAFVKRAGRIIARGFPSYRPSAQRKILKYARGGQPPVERHRPKLMRQGSEVGFSKLGFDTLCESVV